MIASLLVLATSAPQATPAPGTGTGAAPSFLDVLLGEVAALRDLLGGGDVLLFLLVVGLAWGLAAGAARLLRAARRSGYSGRRPWFSRAQVVVTAVVIVWAAALLGRVLLSRAPVVALVVVLAFLCGVLVSLAARLLRVAGGGLLVIRGRISEGDRVAVAGIEGKVEQAGLLRLQLRRLDGAVVYLPTSMLDEHAVVVAHRERSRPLEVRLDHQRPVTQVGRELVRRAALLCPFRVLGSEVDVRSPDGEPTVLVVRLLVWGEAAVHGAELYLHRALAPPTSRLTTLP